MYGDCAAYYGYSPVSLAAKYNQTDILDMLLGEFGAMVEPAEAYRSTPLECAVADGSAEAVSLLLFKYRATRDRVSLIWGSPLETAAWGDCAEIAKLLLSDYRITAESMKRYIRPALLIAIRSTRLAVLKVLLSTPGVDVNHVCGGLHCCRRP
jgi:hypothetical protein